MKTKKDECSYSVSNAIRTLAMKRMMGFALFCFSMGMLVMLVLHSRFFGFLLLVLCMIAGYYLFCCDD